MKVYARRNGSGQIIVYPAPKTVKSWWTGAIRRQGKCYEECRYHGDMVIWTDVTDEVREAMNPPVPQEEPTPYER